MIRRSVTSSTTSCRISDFLDALFDVIYRDAFSGASMAEVDTTALIHRVAEGLLWQCPQRSQDSPTPRRGSMNKLYFVDPVSASLASLRNSAYLAPDPTMLVEQQLGMALRRRIEANSPGRWAEGFAGILATRNVLDTSGPQPRAWAVPAAMLAFLIDT